MPSAWRGAELSSRVLGLHFLLSGKRSRSLVIRPGLWSAPALPLPSPAGRVSGVCGEVLARADPASFHGHKHFPAPLQLRAFGVHGPALPAAPVSAGAFQGCPSWRAEVLPHGNKICPLAGSRCLGAKSPPPLPSYPKPCFFSSPSAGKSSERASYSTFGRDTGMPGLNQVMIKCSEIFCFIYWLPKLRVWY